MLADSWGVAEISGVRLSVCLSTRLWQRLSRPLSRLALLTVFLILCSTMRTELPMKAFVISLIGIPLVAHSPLLRAYWTPGDLIEGMQIRRPPCSNRSSAIKIVFCEKSFREWRVEQTKRNNGKSRFFMLAIRLVDWALECRFARSNLCRRVSNYFDRRFCSPRADEDRLTDLSIERRAADLFDRHTRTVVGTITHRTTVIGGLLLPLDEGIQRSNLGHELTAATG